VFVVFVVLFVVFIVWFVVRFVVFTRSWLAGWSIKSSQIKSNQIGWAWCSVGVAVSERGYRTKKVPFPHSER